MSKCVNITKSYLKMYLNKRNVMHIIAMFKKLSRSATRICNKNGGILF